VAASRSNASRLRAGDARELELLEGEDGAVGRVGAVDAAMGSLRQDALDAVAAGGAGDAAEGAARFGARAAASWARGVHCPPAVGAGIVAAGEDAANGGGGGWAEHPRGARAARRAPAPGRHPHGG